MAAGLADTKFRLGIEAKVRAKQALRNLKQRGLSKAEIDAQFADEVLRIDSIRDPRFEAEVLFESQSGVFAENEGFFKSIDDKLRVLLKGGSRGDLIKYYTLRTILFPFKVPFNVVKRGFSIMPITGIVYNTSSYYAGSLSKIKKWDRAYARSMLAKRMAWQMGALPMGVAGYFAWKEGLVTGAQPRNETERKLAQSGNWKPFSVKLGSAYVSAWFMNPVLLPVFSGAAMAEAEADENNESTADILLAGAWNSIKAPLDDMPAFSTLQGLAKIDLQAGDADEAKRSANRALNVFIGDAIAVSTPTWSNTLPRPLSTTSTNGFMTIWTCLLYTSPSPRDS